MGIFIGILEEGLIYAILALGVLITYRILDFPDLTVDSSFPLGAAVSAILTVNGMHPVLTLLMATLAGAAAYTRSIRLDGVGRGGKLRDETLEIRSLNNARAARARKGKAADLGFKPATVTRVE